MPQQSWCFPLLRRGAIGALAGQTVEAKIEVTTCDASTTTAGNGRMDLHL